MGRRRVGEENIRKLQLSSGSYTIAIPIELIREFDWQERQKLVVERASDQKLIIRDWKP